MSLYACCDHCSIRGPHEAHVSPCSATCRGATKLPSKAPSSPVETTAGSGQRPDHTGVIRGADEAETRLLGHCPACHSPMYGPCGTCISNANAAGTTWEVKRLKANEAAANAHVERLQAAIEWMWAQLNEATDTPHNDPEFGFDKTAALSEAIEVRQVHQWRHGHTAEQVQAADDRRAL